MTEDLEKNKIGSEVFWLLASLLGVFVALVINLNFLPRSEDPILRGAQTLDEIRDIVKTKYVREVDDEELYYAALRGMVSELDPYSTFVSPEDREEFMSSLRGDFGGLGIYVSMQAGILTVIAPIEGTPAFEAGMLAGDRILKIDGESVEGVTILEATKRLKGEVGTDVTLTVLHPERSETEEITITRAKIKIESVKGPRMLDAEAGIAYLRLTQFQTDTWEEFREAVVELKEHGMKKLVLDLRFNPGGVMAAAEKLADEFLEEGVIVSTIERNGDTETSRATKGGLLVGVPTAILVNHGSASASEILAAALQDHGAAIVVGTRSFGKGMVQSVFPVDSRRSMLKITTAYYYTPCGHCVHSGAECRHEEKFCYHRKNEKELGLGGLAPNVEVELARGVETQLRRFMHNREIERQKHDEQMTRTYDQMIMSMDAQLAAALKHLRNEELYDEALAKITRFGPTGEEKEPRTLAGPRPR